MYRHLITATRHQNKGFNLTLRVTSICKSFGPRQALDDVSLHVAPGEFLALLGPNGAGKTTLFQILSGLFTADLGRAIVCGSDIGKTPIAALSQLGIVFQQPALDLDLSVMANLQFQADLHGIARHEARQRIGACLSRYSLATPTFPIFGDLLSLFTLGFLISF